MPMIFLILVGFLSKSLVPDHISNTLHLLDVAFSIIFSYETAVLLVSGSFHGELHYM